MPDTWEASYYRTSAQAEIDLVLTGPRGRVLGGCSSINGMIYMRGQRADYDHWQALGNPGWCWDDVLPYFKRSEDHHAGATEMHGAGGEWRVEQQRHARRAVGQGLQGLLQGVGGMGVVAVKSGCDLLKAARNARELFKLFKTVG